MSLLTSYLEEQTCESLVGRACVSSCECVFTSCLVEKACARSFECVFVHFLLIEQACLSCCECVSTSCVIGKACARSCKAGLFISCVAVMDRTAVNKGSSYTKIKDSSRKSRPVLESLAKVSRSAIILKTDKFYLHAWEGRLADNATLRNTVLGCFA